MLLVRRVMGTSMEPTIRSGRIILALAVRRYPRAGDVMLFRHDGIEKIKRVVTVKGDRAYLIGDNREDSLDSRHFGWVAVSSMKGRLVWPRVN